MKKFIASLLFITTCALLFCSSVIYADFGSGVITIAENTKVIKTGIFGKKISFCDADFKQALCINDFDKITVTKLPSSLEGTLMLAGRRVGEGTQIKRKNLPSLVFIPASKDVNTATFKFKIDGYLDGAEVDFILKFTDKINYEPEIGKEAQDSLSLSTQREIGIFGKMYATDKENDEIEYIIVSYPTEGTLEILNDKTGEYLYTPSVSYTGKDSFIYVARDQWGNFSKTQTVNISVTERLSEVVYSDMKKHPDYNAAVAMTAMGIMDGKIIGSGNYFSPEKEVTRAEFLSMVMKALGVKCDTTLSESYFDDNNEIPEPLVGYVATAARIGAVNGKFVDGALLFRPNEAITKYEAAVIISKMTGKKLTYDTPVFNDTSSIPAWARNEVYTMYSLGIFDTKDGNINATDTVTKAECAKYLYMLVK